MNNYFLVYSTQRQGIYVLAFEGAVIPEKYATYPTINSTNDFTTQGILDTLSYNNFASGSLGTNFAITFSSDNTSATKATNLADFTEQVWVINPLKIVGGALEDDLDAMSIAARRRMRDILSNQKIKFIDIINETDEMLTASYTYYCNEIEEFAKVNKQTVEANLVETITEEEKQSISLLSTLGVSLNARQMAILNGHLTSESIAAYVNNYSDNSDSETEDDGYYDENVKYCENCDEDVEDCVCDENDEF